MAVSKSWSGGAATPALQKVFTIGEANRALPLVRRIVADVVRTHEEATVLHARLEERLPGAVRDNVQDALEKAVDKLADLVDELRAIGCELKDYRLGLIDFLARHGGREICLCWKHGEMAVDYWHELHDGFAGRQPVSTLK
jgi:hypothetical protein